MQRRKFIQQTGVVAFGVGVFGNISWDNDKFIGDTATTTDILGPFYRPNAPVRININPANYTGSLFHLSGTIYKADGKTAFANSLVEIWQCDEHKVYDNITDDFNYRGSQRVGKDGKYRFVTTLPLPYPLTPGSAIYRPAHIHMRVSGEGQQDLITQIYFKDDPYIEKDPSAKSQEAISRILPVNQNKKGEQMVEFNVMMQKEFKAGIEVYKKISGIYEMNDQSLIEFYKDGDMLFMKRNGQIVEGLRYSGNNTFEGGADGSNTRKAVFQLLEGGAVNVKLESHNSFRGNESKTEGAKTFKY